jgi:hypothetical protein
LRKISLLELFLNERRRGWEGGRKEEWEGGRKEEWEGFCCVVLNQF